MDALHAGLGAVSFIPGPIGSFAAAADGGLYLAQGDYVSAGMSFAGAIPGERYAQAIGKGAEFVRGGSKIEEGAKVLGEGGKIAQEGSEAIAGVDRVGTQATKADEAASTVEHGQQEAARQAFPSCTRPVSFRADPLNRPGFRGDFREWNAVIHP